MTFTLILDREEQDRAFGTILRAFTGQDPPSNVPSQGEAVDLTGRVQWFWATTPKSGHSQRLLRINDFHVGTVRLRVTVPLGYRDINDLGILARDSSGHRYLARQKVPNRERTKSAARETAFSERHTPDDYPTFLVRGESSTRTYYAIVPLDSGDQAIIATIERALLPRGPDDEPHSMPA